MRTGHDGKSEDTSCQGRCEESDSCIVPRKLANKYGDSKPQAELVEGRRLVEGKANCNACSGLCTEISMI